MKKCVEAESSTLLQLSPLMTIHRKRVRGINRDNCYMSKFVQWADVVNSAPLLAHTTSANGYMAEICASRKSMQQPPWHASTPCCIPVVTGTVRTDEAALPHGGRQKCFRISNLLSAVQCGGRDELYVVQNGDNCATVRQYELTTHQHQGLKAREVMNFNHPLNVCDMECVIIKNERYMITRSTNQIDIQRIGSEIEYCNTNIKGKGDFTSASMHKSMPGWWIQSDELQEVSVCSSLESRPIWSCKIPAMSLNLTETSHWCCAIFGNDYNEAFALNSLNIYRGDLRRKELMKCFNLSDMWDVVGEDDICNLVPVPGRPYMFCVLSDNVVLLDQRQCKLPVVSWSHMMSMRPTRATLTTVHGNVDTIRGFRDITQGGSDHMDVLVLANGYEKTLSLVGVMGCEARQETFANHLKSTALVSHERFYDRLKDVAYKNNLFCDVQVSKRLKLGWTGLADVTFHNNSAYTTGVTNAFNLLVCNSGGDIFSQAFSLNKDSTECAGDGDVGALLSAWEDDIIKLADPSGDADNVFNVYDVTLRYENCCSGRSIKQDQKRSAVTQTINDVWHTHIMVNKLRSNLTYMNIINNVTSNVSWLNILLQDYGEDCEQVDLNDEEDDVISKYVSCDKSNKISVKYLNSCDDPVAKMVQSHWPLSEAKEMDVLMLNDGIAESVENYRSLPYSTSYTSNTTLRKVKKRRSSGSVRSGTQSEELVGASDEDGASLSSISGNNARIQHLGINIHSATSGSVSSVSSKAAPAAPSTATNSQADASFFVFQEFMEAAKASVRSGSILGAGGSSLLGAGGGSILGAGDSSILGAGGGSILGIGDMSILGIDDRSMLDDSGKSILGNVSGGGGMSTPAAFHVSSSFPRSTAKKKRRTDGF